jgi:UDP-N-acetylmuramate-alanine ligase
VLRAAAVPQGWEVSGCEEGRGDASGALAEQVRSFAHFSLQRSSVQQTDASARRQGAATPAFSAPAHARWPASGARARCRCASAHHSFRRVLTAASVPLRALAGAPPDALVAAAGAQPSRAELAAAQRSGVPVLSTASWAAAATARTAVYAVAGTHGAASAGAMLAACLADGAAGDADVRCALSAPPRLRSQAEQNTPRWPAPRRLVLEVPLSRCTAGALDGIRPAVALILNIRGEDAAAQSEAAARLARSLRPGGALLLCGDDAGAAALATQLATSHPHGDGTAVATTSAEEGTVAARAVITFGLGPSNDWRAVACTPNAAGGTDFLAVRRGAPVARVALRQPGEAAVRAALGALAATALLAAAAPTASSGGGLDMLTAAAGGDAAGDAAGAAAAAAAATLRRFPGVARALQRVGASASPRRRRVIVYDDAATDAAAVQEALAAAAQRHDGSPLWAVFSPPPQLAPAALDALTRAFDGAARVVVLPSGDAGDASAALAAAVVGTPAVHAACVTDAAARLAFELSHADADAGAAADAHTPPLVIISMGAPAVAPFGAALLARLRGPVRQ